jgi:(R,R)-butanediol dehydrogenase/meso-butanediol dehydrogenase/diacetyl reductase
MKAAIWTGAGSIELGEVPVPAIGGDDVLIDVKAAGVCGTDLTIYQGKFPKDRSKPPLVLGHEFSGTVAVLGKNAAAGKNAAFGKHAGADRGGGRGLEAGDRVVVDPLISCGKCYACVMGAPHVCLSLKLIGVDIDGGFAPHVRASASRVHRLPEGLSFEEGAMVEPLAVAVHAIRRSGMKVGDGVLVTGGGPIGILAALAARSAGARALVVSEIQEFRLKLLRELGLTGFNPLAGGSGNTPGAGSAGGTRELVEEHFGGVGPDVVIELTGTDAGMQQAIESVRFRGTIVAIGLTKGVTGLDTRRVVFGEVTMTGSRVYSPVDIETSIDLIASGKVNVRPLIKIFRLEEAPSLFRKMAAGEGNLMKAIFLLGEG